MRNGGAQCAGREGKVGHKAEIAREEKGGLLCSGRSALVTWSTPMPVLP